MIEKIFPVITLFLILSSCGKEISEECCKCSISDNSQKSFIIDSALVGHWKLDSIKKQSTQLYYLENHQIMDAVWDNGQIDLYILSDGSFYMKSITNCSKQSLARSNIIAGTMKSFDNDKLVILENNNSRVTYTDDKNFFTFNYHISNSNEVILSFFHDSSQADVKWWLDANNLNTFNTEGFMESIYGKRMESKVEINNLVKQ